MISRDLVLQGPPSAVILMLLGDFPDRSMRHGGDAGVRQGELHRERVLMPNG